MNKTCKFSFIPCVLLVLIWGTTSAQDSRNYKVLRMKMVEEQIANRGVKTPEVLDALKKVERHRFVPPEMEPYAYRDSPLGIGYGQTISQPYIVAYMTEVLKLTQEDKVLEIGTGSGYQAAILGEISSQVFTIEIVDELGIRARDLLSELGYDHIKVKIGDGYKGWLENAPFDAIIVTCAPDNIPMPLQEQLAEGGRMIIPVGKAGSQQLILIKKIKGKLRKQAVMNVRFVPMLNEQGEKY